MSFLGEFFLFLFPLHFFEERKDGSLSDEMLFW